MTETGRGVVYEPKILRSMVEICNTFGVGPERVRKWIQEGAPIVVEGDGKCIRYSTEVMRLQRWREQQKKPH